MANYIYKGYGVTDSNGIAKLDHDASGNAITHSYTGVGAGEVDFIGSTDGPSDIGDGSFQSEPCEVMDYIAYDNGLDTDYSNIWTGDTSDLSRTSEGSLFSSTSLKTIKNSVLISGDFEATLFNITSPSFVFILTTAPAGIVVITTSGGYNLEYTFLPKGVTWNKNISKPSNIKRASIIAIKNLIKLLLIENQLIIV